MNDRAREALVAAALNGVKQIRYGWRDDHGGFCALGVLMEDCKGWHLFSVEHLDKEYGLTKNEREVILRANDVLGWDFLTIARKFGNNDSGVSEN